MSAYIPQRSGPQWAHIREDIAREIHLGHLKEGDPIPSLREICQRYGVSGITARRAQSDLLNEGLAVRRPGIGLFVHVKQRPLRIVLAQIGFSEEGWRRNSEMFGQLVGGIAGAAWEHDAMLSIVAINEASEAPNALSRLLEQQQVDGVLLRTMGDVTPRVIQTLRKRGVPFVLVKRQVPGIDTLYVRTDDYRGGYLAIEHLVQQGHRRIGLILSVAARTISVDIERGCRAAFAQAHLPVDDGVVAYAATALERVGKEHALRLLSLPERPTAIFTSSDLLALGVYDAASSLGLRIPQDVAVVGFDDQEFARRLMPPLTSIQVSYYDLGHRAADLLLQTIKGGEHVTAIVSEVRLVTRGSTLGQPVEN